MYIHDLARCVLEENFTSFYDVNCQNLIHNNLISKMFSLVPLSRLKIKRKSMEWMTCPDVLYARSLGDVLYEVYINERTSHKWNVYTNKAKRTIERMKKSHFGRTFNNYDPKCLWNRLRIASSCGSVNDMTLFLVRCYFQCL